MGTDFCVTGTTPPDCAGDGAIKYATASATSLTSSADPTSNLALQPRYMIELLGFERDAVQGAGRTAGKRQDQPGSPGMLLFRITARSTGGSDTSVRIVESVFSAYGNNHQFNPG
jgi:type IV pilus assembly protein PilX